MVIPGAIATVRRTARARVRLRAVPRVRARARARARVTASRQQQQSSTTADAAAAIPSSLPHCSPTPAMPILQLLQSSSSCRMGVAAVGEQRSSGVAGLGVAGVGGGWWIFVCTIQCLQSPTQKSCVGAKICQPRHACRSKIGNFLTCCRHVANIRS